MALLSTTRDDAGLREKLCEAFRNGAACVNGRELSDLQVETAMLRYYPVQSPPSTKPDHIADASKKVQKETKRDPWLDSDDEFKNMYAISASKKVQPDASAALKFAMYPGTSVCDYCKATWVKGEPEWHWFDCNRPVKLPEPAAPKRWRCKTCDEGVEILKTVTGPDGSSWHRDVDGIWCGPVVETELEKK
jgi:hypothetical protein